MADPSSGRVVFFAERMPPHVLKRFLKRDNQVVVAELAAVLVALRVMRDELRGRDVVFFVDAEAVEAALVKGTSSASDLSSLIDDIWRSAVEAGVAIYFDRVPTDSNIADQPSRGFVAELARRGAVRRAASGVVQGLGGTPRSKGGTRHSRL